MLSEHPTPEELTALADRVVRRGYRLRARRRLVQTGSAAAIALVLVGVTVSLRGTSAEKVHTISPSTTTTTRSTVTTADVLPGASDAPVTADNGVPANTPDSSSTAAPVGPQPPAAAPSSEPLRLAYTGTDGKIYVGDGTGHDRALTSGFDPRWSPDRTRLLFWSGTGDTATCDTPSGNTGRCTAQVRSINVDGTGERVIVNPGVHPDWSPDGAHIVYLVAGPQVTAATVWIADADGTHAHQLTNGDDRHPRWSPDGSTIVFEHAVSDGTESWTALATIHPDGTGFTTILSSPGLSAYQPAWSPDGRHLAFAGYDYNGNKISIWVMDLPNGVPSQVTNGPAGSTYVDNMDYSPSWSPDGTRIAYTNDPDGASGVYWCDAGPTTGCAVAGPQPPAIYEIAVDGSAKREVTAGSNATYG